MNNAIVYLAGAAYSPEEASGMKAAASFLESRGFDVYLPPHDGLGPPLTLFEPGELDRSKLATLTLALAVFQLARRCDCLVLNLNGRVPDEGGAFEAAMAFTLGTPVVLYKRDHRSELHGQDNAMITGLSHDFSSVRTVKRLPDKIMKAVGRYPRPSGRTADIPSHLHKTVELGDSVWRLLEKFRKAGVSPGPAELAVLHDAYRVVT